MINIQDLTAGYFGNKVIRGFSLSIGEGEIYFLLGRNGSGKSTFLKALGSEIPYEGSISIANSNAHKLSIKQRAGIIATLPQQVQIAFDVEIVELILAGKFHQKKLLEGYTKAEEAEALAIIKDLGFAKPNQTIQTLSGGEQQMIWLAQVGFQNTPVVLLDEPTQYLDLYYKRLVFEQLKNWVASGKTIVVSTHDTQYLQQFPNAKLLFFQKEKAPMVLENNQENRDLIIRTIEQGG